MFKFTSEDQFNESVENVLSTIQRQVEWPVEINYRWAYNASPYYIASYDMVVGPFEDSARYVREVIEEIVDHAQIAECERVMDECDLDSLSIRAYTRFELDGDEMYGNYHLTFYGAM